MDISVRTTDYGVEDRSWLGSAHGTTATRTITLDTSAFTAATHFPDGYVKSGTVLGRITASGLYGPYAGRTNEVQTLTVTGAPTGGTFTLSFDGATTAAIAYNAAAATVQAALLALPSIGAGEVTVTGGAGGPWTVTFLGGLAGTNVAAITTDATSLTGGTTPNVTVTGTTAGGSAGTGGLETAAGFLFNTTPMVDAGADVGAPLLELGIIVAAKLPVNHGLDSAARSDLAGHFIFR
jgi:hypothetical protein